MTFENLESVFKKGKRPYWVLYKGNSKGTVLASMYEDDDGKPGIDDSWNSLADVMNEFDDGIYSIELKSSPTSSRGNPFLTFQVGDGSAGIQRGNSSTTMQAADSGAQPRNFLAGLDFKYFLERDAQQQQQINDLKLDLLRQEFKVQNIRREAEEKPEADVVGRILGLAERHPKIIAKWLGGEEQQTRAAIGVLKAEKPIVEEIEDDDEFDDDDQQGISIDRAVICLYRLQKVFPDLNVNELLEQLTDFCEANPKQARNILSSL